MIHCHRAINHSTRQRCLQCSSSYNQLVSQHQLTSFLLSVQYIARFYKFSILHDRKISLLQFHETTLKPVTNVLKIIMYTLECLENQAAVRNSSALQLDCVHVTAFTLDYNCYRLFTHFFKNLPTNISRKNNYENRFPRLSFQRQCWNSAQLKRKYIHVKNAIWNASLIPQPPVPNEIFRERERISFVEETGRRARIPGKYFCYVSPQTILFTSNHFHRASVYNIKWTDTPLPTTTFTHCTRRSNDGILFTSVDLSFSRRLSCTRCVENIEVQILICSYNCVFSLLMQNKLIRFQITTILVNGFVPDT